MEFEWSLYKVKLISAEEIMESFEDALVKAKELKTKDYMEIKGEYNDGSEQLLSVGQNELWNVD